MLKRFLAATVLATGLVFLVGVEPVQAECFYECFGIWIDDEPHFFCIVWCD